MAIEKNCSTCKNEKASLDFYPCAKCQGSSTNFAYWQPKEDVSEAMRKALEEENISIKEHLASTQHRLEELSLLEVNLRAQVRDLEDVRENLQENFEKVAKELEETRKTLARVEMDKASDEDSAAEINYSRGRADGLLEALKVLADGRSKA